MAAPASFISNFSHGQIILTDSGAASTVTMTLDQGDFSASGLADRLREIAAYETRGTLRGVALTNRTYPTISFTSLISEWSDASAGTVLDLITGAGEFSGRTGTLGANHPVVCLDVEFKFTDYDAAVHDLKFHDVNLTFDFSEGDPDTISLSGTVYGEIDGDLSMDG